MTTSEFSTQLEVPNVQGYLARKKTPTPWDPPRSLGIAYRRVLGGCVSLKVRYPCTL